MRVVLLVLVVLFALPVVAVAQTATPTPVPPTYEQQAVLPVGAVAMWVSNTLPDGWLPLDSQCISVETYEALHSVIGHITGGAPTCPAGEFRLPDMRSRSPVGVGDGGANLTEFLLHHNGGSETHQLTEPELAAHDHWSGTVQGAQPSGGGASWPTGGSRLAQTLTSAGENQPFSIRDPYRAVYFIIWTGVLTLQFPECGECEASGGGWSMLPSGDVLSDVFGFFNIFVPLAFVIAGFMVAFKLQWQAFFYFLVVVYAVDDINKFVFITFVMVAQVVLSRLRVIAAS